MIPIRELTDKELDAVCGGLFQVINNRSRQTNIAVVVASSNVGIFQINNVANIN